MKIFDRFDRQLVDCGLASPGAPLMGFLDARLLWNRESPLRPVLEPIFEQLNITSLLFSKPAEPYASILDYLALSAPSGRILPEDCETRTFLHDLPVAPTLSPEAVVPFLRQRKCVVIPGKGIITYGSVTMEQAFVTFSSTCFAAFVKFFGDVLKDIRAGRRMDTHCRDVFENATRHIDPLLTLEPELIRGPFQTEGQVLQAMAEAGRQTVACRLVDSYFGNISCRLGDILYISQTGSSLDRLEACIDPVPLDNSSCAGLTSSSELSAHMAIVEQMDIRTILHGHPRFAVILSMDCEGTDCDCQGQCHRYCPHERSLCGVPVVSGEVGTGVHGLCRTVPPALTRFPSVIVYGHGVFTTGRLDFRDAFRNLLTTEYRCREEYFRRVGAVL